MAVNYCRICFITLAPGLEQSVAEKYNLVELCFETISTKIQSTWIAKKMWREILMLSNENVWDRFEEEKFKSGSNFKCDQRHKTEVTKQIPQ